MRFAEYAVDKVYGLITSVSQKNLAGVYALMTRKLCLERLLQGIGITVESLIVRAFIGIQKHMRVSTLKFVTGTAIWLQCPYILSYKFLQCFHFFILFTSSIRKVMALLWASSISPCAIQATAGPMWLTPSGVMCWKVTFRI